MHIIVTILTTYYDYTVIFLFRSPNADFIGNYTFMIWQDCW